MSQSELQRAYALIQQGNRAEAIDIIEPILRTDRDNRDAWWLLAHASDDTAQKRRAFNAVLRLNSDDERAQQARQHLEALATGQTSPDLSSVDVMLQSQGQPPLATRESSLGCWKIGLLIASVFGCILIVGVVGVGIVAMNFAQDFIRAPERYTDAGTIAMGDEVTGDVAADADRIGYVYSAQAGDIVELTIERNERPGVPLIFVYDLEGELMGGTNTQINMGEDVYSEDSGNTTISFGQTGDYLIIVRPFCALGTCLGVSDYVLRVE